MKQPSANADWEDEFEMAPGYGFSKWTLNPFAERASQAEAPPPGQ